MITLYIFDATNYQDHIDNSTALNAPITQFSGDTNDDCERQAKDANYDDSDLFAWSYTNWANQ